MTRLTDKRSRLAWVERWTDLLDTKFAIPGTNIRFGADFLLGLIPGVGDSISLGFSGMLIVNMAKHGASSQLIVRMLLNVLLDTTLGSIPLLGNVFDLFYKANQRNLRLMQEHYEEGKHSGSAVPLLILVAIALLLAIGAMLWGAMLMIGWIWHAFALAI